MYVSLRHRMYLLYRTPGSPPVLPPEELWTCREAYDRCPERREIESFGEAAEARAGAPSEHSISILGRLEAERAKALGWTLGGDLYLVGTTRGSAFCLPSGEILATFGRC